MKTSLGGLDIVLVEDHEDSRWLFEALLRDEGATVRAASAAEEGMELLRARRPHLLIADLGMPGEDGYSLLRRALELYPEIAAIAVSGHAGSEDVGRALEAGYLAHLKKPVGIEELVAAVARFGRKGHPSRTR